jgi:hypothetical protein
MKDDTQKEKHNNNEHKQDIVEVREILMGVLVQLLQVERKICHHEPPTTPQYSFSTFAIIFQIFTNNQYNCWDRL